MVKKRIAAALMAVMMTAGSTVPAFATSPSAQKTATSTYASSFGSWGNWGNWGNWGGSWDEPGSDTEESISLAAPTLKVESQATNKRRTLKSTWNKVDGATEYVIQESTSPDFDNNVYEKTTTNTSFTHVHINSAAAPVYGPSIHTYYIRVKAVSGNSESKWSNVVESKGMTPVLPKVQ